MTQRRKIDAIRVAVAKVHPAAAASSRLERNDFVALLDGNQGPLVPRMAGLAAALAFRFRLGGGRLGVWMLCRWRQRRVLRRLTEPILQFSYFPFQRRHLLVQRGHVFGKRGILSQQRANNRPRLRRLASNHFLRDFDLRSTRHANNVAQTAKSTQDQFPSP
jgi:hypothetical protein